MNKWLVSLNGAVALGIVAFATLIARITILDALYVPEVRALLPESQPTGIAVTMVVFMVFLGVWDWALLATSHGSRGGLIVGLLYSLFTAFSGLITLTSLCPTGCAAPPAGDAIVWANLIFGLAASLALGLQLTQSRAAGRAPWRIARGKTS